MALLNKYINAVFGLATFGRAVFALRPDSQNIPSEIYDDYTRVVQLARKGGEIGKRYPWDIKQLGSSIQRAQWNRFFRGTWLFGLQDAARRAQWFTVAIPSGLFYYTYFMSRYLAGDFLAVSGRAISGLAISGNSEI